MDNKSVFHDPELRDAFMQQVRLLPNGQTTVDEELWYDIWFRVALNERNVTPEELLDTLDEDAVENMVKQVYLNHIKNLLH